MKSRKNIQIKLWADETDKKRIKDLAELMDTTDSHVIRLAIKLLSESNQLEIQNRMRRKEDKSA